MRILSTTLGTVRHAIGATAEAVVVMAIAVTLVLGVAVVARNDPAGAAAVYAAKGGNGNAGASGGGGGGGPSASIALIEPARLAAGGSWPTVGSSVSFAVNANVKERDLYSLWVANECFQDGVKVYAEYLSVRDGTSGPFTLGWASGAASCTAYVWLFPDVGDVLSGGTTNYAVN